MQTRFMTKALLCLFLFSAAIFSSVSFAAGTHSVAWGDQFGTDLQDSAKGIAIDEFGDVYVSGVTSGVLTGVSQGLGDAYIRKSNGVTGELIWTRQFGSSETDIVHDITTDGMGSVYVTGDTEGSLAGPYAGLGDMFLAKYDLSGNQIWASQLGNSQFNRSFGTATDNMGNVFIAGYTSGVLGVRSYGERDGIVSKYDSDGNRIFVLQFGTSSDDTVLDIDTDDLGNVYVTGRTEGDFVGTSGGESDVIVAKFDNNLRNVWTRQFGSSQHEQPDAVFVDSERNSYIVGSTNGDLAGDYAGGGADIFVKKYDEFGNDLWTRQFGSDGNDTARDVAVDDEGFIYITGATTSDLNGPFVGGFSDAYLMKLDPLGNTLWSKQIASDNLDLGRGVAIGDLSSIYVTGRTKGDLYGSALGSDDGFIVKFAIIPEPTSLALATLSLLVIAYRRRLGRRG